MEDEGSESGFWEVSPPPSGATSSLATLAAMREQGQLCDVVLETESGEQIQAHRSVLAACSPYFRAMFVNNLCESNQQIICLKDVEFDILEAVVAYAYNHRFVLPNEKALLLLVASDLLQIRPLFGKCCEFLELRLRPSNCLSVRAFADLHSCKRLFKRSTSFVLDNFEEVVQSSEYLSLPCDQLKDLISRDDVKVSTEEQLYKAVLQWVYHNLEKRKKFFPEVMSHVRLPFVSEEFLTCEVVQEELMQEEVACQRFIHEAYLYKSSPEKRPSLRHSRRTTPRKLSGLQDVILAVGGMSKTGQPLASIEQYNGRVDAWTTLTNMEVPRYALAACFIDGCLITVGGHSEVFGYLNSVESYNLKEDKWKMLAPMHVARRYHAVAVLYGLIYAVGGQNQNGVLQSVECYNPMTESWTRVTPMATRRMYHSVTEHEKLMYAIGGHDGHKRLNSVEVYDPAKEQWTVASHMTQPRSVAGIASIGRTIYVVGGYDGKEYLDTMECYDTELDTWCMGTTMCSRRSALGLVAYGGCLYACGGFGGAFHGSVERFVPEAGSWLPVVPMGVERVHFSVTCT